MSIDRKEFIETLNEEKKLRRYIRRCISLVKESKRLKAEKGMIDLSEINLRNYVSGVIDGDIRLIREAATDVEDQVPHKSTGINVLETLLKKIIPVLEDDYKSLTTDEGQRVSFRAHIVQAVKNSLAPVEVTDKIGTDTLKEDIVTAVGDGDIAAAEKFIPVRSIDVVPEEETEEGKEDKFAIAGADATGRNFAYQSYNKVERQVLDAYANLQNDEDKELFYDYLLTNLKLYFDKFEDELQNSLQEPTTPQYEEEKSQEDMPPPTMETV